MKLYIKILAIFVTFAVSPLFGMEPKKEKTNEELMPADHPAWEPLKGNQCYFYDNTLDVRNDLERVLPKELSVKINQMSGILTDEAKKWLAGVSASNVLYFKFSPDSKRVGTEIKDDTCKVIDLETKQVLLSESNVRFCNLSPDGKRVGIKFTDDTCKVIDLETKEVLLSESNVWSFYFSPDSKRVGIQFKDDTFKVTNLETKQVLLSESKVSSFEFSPDSKLMRIRFKDDTWRVIDLWKVIDLETKQVLLSESKVVRFFEFIPNSKLMRITFKDDTYKVIDLELLSSLQYLTICQALYVQEFYEYMTGKKKISKEEGAKLYNTGHGLAVFRTLPASIQQQLIRLRKENIQSAEKRLKQKKYEQENSCCLIQ